MNQQRNDYLRELLETFEKSAVSGGGGGGLGGVLGVIGGYLASQLANSLQGARSAPIEDPELVPVAEPDEVSVEDVKPLPVEDIPRWRWMHRRESR